MSARDQALRGLPKIDDLCRRAELADLSPRWAVVEAARREVDRVRQAILSGDGAGAEVDVAQVRRIAAELCRPSLRRAVNATGVVLHTNLGRAPLAAAAIERITDVASGYSNLEYTVDAGQRGSRHVHVQRLLRELCGADDAAVVNNNAGAVLLALSALAAGREVIVSRGELIEIGGSFRIPDVMRLSGARLVEVGTTNKTRLADYESAVTADTALVLKVHRSNFAIVGFTEEATLAELVDLGRRRGVGVMVDLGSGALIEAAELSAWGLPPEPGIQATLGAGADIVTFSGDKLLGGPQAGILAGQRPAITRARQHPLMRALRPDKLTVAALEATLELYRDGRAAEIPTLAMLQAPLSLLRARASALAARVRPALDITCALVACESAVGGGALPTASLPSWGLALAGRPADRIDDRLRAAEVPVIGRIAEDQMILDVRTVVGDRDEAALVGALASL